MITAGSWVGSTMPEVVAAPAASRDSLGTNQNPNFQIISGSPDGSLKAYGINNAGAIVGEDSDLLRGFILRNGIFTEIPRVWDGDRSVAYAVSESDHVVGTAKLDSSAIRPCMLSCGPMQVA